MQKKEAFTQVSETDPEEPWLRFIIKAHDIITLPTWDALRQHSESGQLNEMESHDICMKHTCL